VLDTFVERVRELRVVVSVYDSSDELSPSAQDIVSQSNFFLSFVTGSEVLTSSQLRCRPRISVIERSGFGAIFLTRVCILLVAKLVVIDTQVLGTRASV